MPTVEFAPITFNNNRNPVLGFYRHLSVYTWSVWLWTSDWLWVIAVADCSLCRSESVGESVLNYRYILRFVIFLLKYHSFNYVLRLLVL